MYNYRKNMKTLKISIICATFTLAIISCKKNVSGCTDPISDNYNIEANVENGSCNYHGNLVAWYDTITRDSLLSNNIASLTIKVDNETFQNINPTFILWSTQPECNTTTIGNWITMQGVKSRSISITAIAFDSTNSVVRSWNHSMIVNAGECELYQIIW